MGKEISHRMTSSTSRSSLDRLLYASIADVTIPSLPLLGLSRHEYQQPRTISGPDFMTPVIGGVRYQPN